MTVSYKTIGRNIREARISVGLTQKEASELLHISTLHWGRFERGERPISLDRLALIAETLNVKVSTLLCGAIPDDCFYLVPPEKSAALGKAIAQLSANCSDKTIRLIFNVSKLLIEADKT